MERFGHLTLICVTAERWRGNVVAVWRCDCGATKQLPMARVKSGNAKSCGCLKTKHGHARKSAERSQEYVAWQAMRSRVGAKPGSRDYEHYAAKGITVCERWLDFNSFLADMGPKPSPSHSLGRINNDAGYSPENCRWETPTEQMRNTSASLRWHIRGMEFASCREAGRHFSVDSKTIRYWVKTEKEGCYAVPKY